MKKPTTDQVKKNMQSIRSKGSKIERKLALALWHNGHRYRLNDKRVPGKPDICFHKLKIAVFCDSEFWHGKNWEKTKKHHKSNQEFWYRKIERNIKRDEEVNALLTKIGWRVLRFWGRQIETELVNCVLTIEQNINEAKSENNT